MKSVQPILPFRFATAENNLILTGIKKEGPAIWYLRDFQQASLSPITHEGNWAYLFAFESRASAWFCFDRILADFRSNLERQKTGG